MDFKVFIFLFMILLSVVLAEYLRAYKFGSSNTIKETSYVPVFRFNVAGNGVHYDHDFFSGSKLMYLRNALNASYKSLNKFNKTNLRKKKAKTTVTPSSQFTSFHDFDENDSQQSKDGSTDSPNTESSKIDSIDYIEDTFKQTQLMNQQRKAKPTMTPSSQFMSFQDFDENDSQQHKEGSTDSPNTESSKIDPIDYIEDTSKQTQLMNQPKKAKTTVTPSSQLTSFYDFDENDSEQHKDGNTDSPNKESNKIDPIDYIEDTSKQPQLMNQEKKVLFVTNVWHTATKPKNVKRDVTELFYDDDIDEITIVQSDTTNLGNNKEETGKASLEPGQKNHTKKKYAKKYQAKFKFIKIKDVTGSSEDTEMNVPDNAERLLKVPKETEESYEQKKIIKKTSPTTRKQRAKNPKKAKKSNVIVYEDTSKDEDEVREAQEENYRKNRYVEIKNEPTEFQAKKYKRVFKYSKLGKKQNLKNKNNVDEEEITETVEETTVKPEEEIKYKNTEVIYLTPGPYKFKKYRGNFKYSIVKNEPYSSNIRYNHNANEDQSEEEDSSKSMSKESEEKENKRKSKARRTNKENSDEETLKDTTEDVETDIRSKSTETYDVNRANKYLKARRRTYIEKREQPAFEPEIPYEYIEKDHHINNHDNIQRYKNIKQYKNIGQYENIRRQKHVRQHKNIEGHEKIIKPGNINQYQNSFFDSSKREKINLYVNNEQHDYTGKQSRPKKKSSRKHLRKYRKKKGILKASTVAKNEIVQENFNRRARVFHTDIGKSNRTHFQRKTGKTGISSQENIEKKTFREDRGYEPKEEYGKQYRHMRERIFGKTTRHQELQILPLQEHKDVLESYGKKKLELSIFDKETVADNIKETFDPMLEYSKRVGNVPEDVMYFKRSTKHQRIKTAKIRKAKHFEMTTTAPNEEITTIYDSVDAGEHDKTTEMTQAYQGHQDNKVAEPIVPDYVIYPDKTINYINKNKRLNPPLIKTYKEDLEHPVVNIVQGM